MSYAINKVMSNRAEARNQAKTPEAQENIAQSKERVAEIKTMNRAAAQQQTQTQSQGVKQ